MITKTARNERNFSRFFKRTDTAREAWSEVIEIYRREYPQGKVLLPAYIGWSPNEGSGIFDSVINAGIDFDFYPVDKFLQIDFSEFRKKTESEFRPLILLVHYFGIVDRQYEAITSWLSGMGHYFVEDCAHAMLTDLIGGRCGRKGKYSFYSLHKMLPMQTGGVLVSNYSNDEIVPVKSDGEAALALDYDFFEIAKCRRSNYELLVEHLRDTKGLTIFHPVLEPGIYPQTLPVMIESDRRNDLYFALNEKGFGVVSLYHTMIEQLKPFENDAIAYTSQHILNLPVHQDATSDDLRTFARELRTLL